MKGCITRIFLIATMAFAPTRIHCAAVSAPALKGVEVFTNGLLSTETRFIFEGPFRFKKSLIESESRLSLTFPDATVGTLDLNQVTSELRRTGLVESFNIEQPRDGGVTVDLKFVTDKVLVKLIKGKESNKLILEIYSKEALAKIRKAHDGPLFLSHNDLAQCSEAKKKYPQFTVLLDAGHGGISVGAIGVNGIKEKDVTLDITKKVRSLLKEAGIRVVMTRTNDDDIPLAERTKLANSCGADLFVSIHANAALNQSAQGIETYLPSIEPAAESAALPGASDGLFFARTTSDGSLAQAASAFLRKRQEYSRLLAQQVQDGLLSTVAGQDIKAVNRGIKEASFLVLARGIVPSILIETGFVTHREEATRLALSSYRQLLAQGIVKGILTYKEQMNIT